MPEETPVLIAGAGPTGLALAATLARHGIQAMLIEKVQQGQTTSRATAVHAGTLHALEPIGATPLLLERGSRTTKLVVGTPRRTLMTNDLGSLPPPYPFVLTIPQTETEAVLRERLTALGGSIRWGCELAGVTEDAGGVTAVVRCDDGERQVRARYLVGADGYHSRVREAAGMTFQPGTYPVSLVLGDVRMRWPRPDNEGHVYLAGGQFLLVFAFGHGRYRLVADQADPPEHPTQADLQAIVDERTPRGFGATITEVIWSSRFRIHHGLVEHWRSGRLFVAGDAAHVHSPAGGQGMNIGIQDACALGDRLAAVLAGTASESSLDDYERTRRPVAAGVVRMTDLMTRAITARSTVVRGLRDLGIATIGRVPMVQHRMARTIAELPV